MWDSVVFLALYFGRIWVPAVLVIGVVGLFGWQWLRHRGDDPWW